MSNESILGAVSLILLIFQGVATLILLSRLIKGATRQPPLQPKTATPEQKGKVSVIIPTLNEAARISPCLAGLRQQSDEIREIIVVDSYSQDGTPEIVYNAANIDPRLRLINDPPLPTNWVGRPWALHNGFLASSADSEWILGIDADTQPQAGLVASIITTAATEGYDLLSLSPQFILQSPGEWWLQPALLMTLLYRFDSSGVKQETATRVMANGQCFLCRRSVLEQLGGYSSASSSFCDDVTLARNAALQGFKVGFLDGAKVIRVRMYEGAKETWEEWGRSLDLKDASSPTQILHDLWLLFNVQFLPLPLTLILAICVGYGYHTLFVIAVFYLNLFLIIIRFALLLAIKSSYYRDLNSGLASWLFWLSPFADTLAVIRLLLSASQRPKQWRGRVYQLTIDNDKCFIQD